MKHSILIILLCCLVSCASTPVDTVEDNVTIDVTRVSENIVICKHKYSRDKFAYYGQLRAYQTTMYGEKVFMYEYTLYDGKKVYLTGDDVVNYVCVPYNDK